MITALNEKGLKPEIHIFPFFGADCAEIAGSYPNTYIHSAEDIYPTEDEINKFAQENIEGVDFVFFQRCIGGILSNRAGDDKDVPRDSLELIHSMLKQTGSFYVGGCYQLVKFYLNAEHTFEVNTINESEDFGQGASETTPGQGEGEYRFEKKPNDIKG